MIHLDSLCNFLYLDLINSVWLYFLFLTDSEFDSDEKYDFHINENARRIWAVCLFKLLSPKLIGT